jgi:RimJ/RimL family protein N-acetyltransferase
MRQTGAVPTLEVSQLSGRHVVLEPMHVGHIDDIATAGAGDRSTFAYTQVPDGRQESADYVDWLVADAARGQAGPFVQRRLADGVVVGCTRYLNPMWPLGRPDPDEVEIGGTWLAAHAQRSPLNTEAKLLLLNHAFGQWKVQRVAICTDARNEQSRRAIERIGARFEGVLRRHRRSTHIGDGDRLRDTASYSITIDDWPEIEDRLQSLVEG